VADLSPAGNDGFLGEGPDPDSADPLWAATGAGNPTVLVANFMNGNNTAFNSRVYLFNPSTNPGNVTVRVFTLPLKDGTHRSLQSHRTISEPWEQDRHLTSSWPRIS